MADALRSPHMRELGSLLRARRSAIDPAEIGINVPGQRRRVTGLRREEVAERACISADYLARIEQGRLVPSISVLESLVSVLNLDDDQIDYVTKLLEHEVQGNVVPQIGARGTQARSRVRPQLQRLLNQLTETPTIVLGPRTDILAWNRLAEEVYLPFSELPPRQLNYVRLVFTDARMRELFADWESVARACIALLRREAAANPDDPALATLVGELTLADDRFGQWWVARDVTRQDFGCKVVRHPIVGDLTLDWDMFRYSSAPDQQVVINSVEEGSVTQQRLAELAARSRATV